LNLNNSKTGKLCPEIFTEVVHDFALYDELPLNPRRVAPFLGGDPPKTQKLKSRDFKAMFTGVPNFLGDEIQKSQSTVLCIRPSATHAQRQRVAIAKH